ncbi:E3 ubiquitin-protein ligase Huwe1, putative, partial [Rhizoctonia solani AG-3 Rhs1AP]
MIDKYDLNKLENFDQADKKLLLELRRFERMLLETRPTESYLRPMMRRLNALLATSDLDVLIAVLQLLLRPSQQYSSQPPTPHSLDISAPRLQALAMRWPGLREAGIKLHELLDKPAQLISVAPKAKAPETSIRFGFGTNSSGFATPTQVTTGASTPRAGIPSSGIVPNSRDVTFQFYRKSVSATQTQQSKPEPLNVEETRILDPQVLVLPQTLSTSSPFSPSKDTSTTGRQTGMTVVRLTDLQSSPKDDTQIVAEAVQKYEIPDEEVFELLCRAQIARILGPNQESTREKLVCAQLLAIAIFG